MVDIPYPTNLKNAMALSPGIVRDAAGGIRINGRQENQVLYTLQGFNITNPLTGRFDTRLSVEAVQSLSAGVYSAEYKQGSSGTLAIQTHQGDNRFRYSAINFVPGIEMRKDLYIGGWTPRATISGPIRKRRAWFSDSIDVQYDQYVVEELPKGQDRVHSWRIGNMLSTQVNLTPSDIISAGFLINL